MNAAQQAARSDGQKRGAFARGTAAALGPERVRSQDYASGSDSKPGVLIEGWVMRKQILFSFFWTLGLSPVLAVAGIFLTNAHGSLGKFAASLGLLVLMPAFLLLSELGFHNSSAGITSAVVVCQFLYWFSGVMLVRLAWSWLRRGGHLQNQHEA